MKRRNMMKTALLGTLICTMAAFGGESAAIKGNANSKVFHRPDCHHYSAKGSTVSFNSEAEALKAGYTACRQCCKESAEKKPSDGKK